MIEEITLVDEKTIKDKMYFIRDQYVMIDSDLAKIYGYTTKGFNQQVRRNIEKFEDDFMFQLDKNEYHRILRSQNVTLELEQGKYSKYLPYAFTEQGIYMLMTVLKGELAVKQSKQLIRVFKKMKDFLVNNDLLNMVIRHDTEIKQLQETFDKFNKEEDEMYLDNIWKAYSKLLDILIKGKKELIIIDGYTDKSFLDMASNLNCNIILITSHKTKITKIDLEKYNTTYNNLKIYYDDTFHDRYIIIDREEIYLSGNSINHLGKRKSTISLLKDKKIKNTIINNILEIIN